MPKVKKEKETEEDAQGFKLLELTRNLSLSCWACSKKPNKFYWRTKIGKTEIYCHDCMPKEPPAESRGSNG